MKKLTLFFLITFTINFLYAIENEIILQEKFPKKLSEFSFFKDSQAQIPSERVVPYELISSLFLTTPINKDGYIYQRVKRHPLEKIRYLTFL